MTPYTMHLRRSVFTVVAPIVAVLGAALAWQQLYPQVMRSADIADVLNSTAGTLAPVLAGFAAWDGLRERRHGGAPILDSASQPAARVVLLQWLAGLTYTCAVFAVLLAALHIRALRYTLADPPLWLHLGVVLLVLCLATSVGYVMAAVFRHWCSVLFAAFVPAFFYWHHILVRGDGLVQSLVPFGHRAGDEFLDINPPFFVGQLFFLAGIGVFMAGVTLLLSRLDRVVGAVLTCSAVVATVMGALGVHAQQSRWGIPVDDLSERLVDVKSSDGSLTLRIPPSYLPVETDLLERWGRVQQIFADTPAAFTELALVSQDHAPYQGSHAGRFSRIYLNPASSMIATDSVTESLIDFHHTECHERQSDEATWLVQLWLAGEGSERFVDGMFERDVTALAALRSLSIEESRRWMAQHHDDFVACTIERADLPIP